MKKLYIFVITLTMAALAACNTTDPEMPFRPVSMPPLPTGSPEFTQGWKDGCVSGMAVYGDATYKTIYKFTQDQDLTRNETYYKAWKDSYNYCRHFSQVWNKSFTASGPAMTPLDLPAPKDPLFDNDTDFLNMPGETSWGSYGDIFGNTMNGDFLGMGGGSNSPSGM